MKFGGLPHLVVAIIRPDGGRIGGGTVSVGHTAGGWHLDLTGVRGHYWVDTCIVGPDLPWVLNLYRHQTSHIIVTSLIMTPAQS